MDEVLRTRLWLSTIIHNKREQFTVNEVVKEMADLGFRVSKTEVKDYLDSLDGLEVVM